MAGADARGVEALFARGRLIAIPRRRARRAQLLAHLAERLFQPGRDYTEQQVNEALLTVHEDCASLRRHLVDEGWLARSADGTRYRRVR